MKENGLLRWTMHTCAVWAMMICGCAEDGGKREMRVVEVHELATSHAPPAVLIDVRPVREVEAGRLRDAIRLDVQAWSRAARMREEGFENRIAWEERIGTLGIAPDDRVIVYDDGSMIEAARVWFILQLFGVRRASVLNGGFPAARTALPDSYFVAGPPREPAAKRFAGATVQSGAVALATREDVRRSLDAREIRVFDARTPEEFSGKDLRANQRGGHLPGAVNIPHERLLTEGGRLRPRNELRRLMEEAGFSPRQRIVTHCDGGGRAALAALAAVEAGYGPVENYYLSFADWAANDNCPIEAGEK